MADLLSFKQRQKMLLETKLNKGQSITAARPTPETLATSFVQDYAGGKLRFYQSQFYRFNGKTFEIWADVDFQAALTTFASTACLNIAIETRKDFPAYVRQITPASIAMSYLRDLRNSIEAATIVDSNKQMPCWLGAGPARHYFSFHNGIVERDVLLGRSAPLEPHTPEWFSTNVLPFDYQPNAECPRWQSFLHEVQEGDQERIALLQEWFGYCLTADTSQQKFLLLEGTGSNGKSVFTHVLEGLLGAANYSSVPIESFSDRFALSATIGKLLNTCSEASKVSPRIEGMLKQFVGGDSITIDRKHIEQLQFKPTARLLITTNKRPSFTDDSDGIWRRMLVVPFRVKIADDKVIKGLDARLLEEASGILNWSIEGLRRLRTQGRFTRSEVMDTQIVAYRAEDSPEMVFLRQHFVLDANSETLAAHMYAAYRVWAEQVGEKVKSNVEVGKLIRRVFPDAEPYTIKTRGALRDKLAYRYIKDLDIPEGESSLETLH